jgi:hypothetical protein
MDIAANAVRRPGSGKNASASRRAGVRSCGENRERRRAWIRPFRRTRRAIKSSFQLITCAFRAIEAVEKFAVARPIRAARELGIASGLMMEAEAQLACAIRGMGKMLDRAAKSPDVSLEAPGMMVGEAVKWIKATAELTAFSERLDEVSLWLLDSLQSGAITIPLEERTGDAGKPVTTFRLIPRPLLPPDWFSYERSDVPSIPSRRPRSVRQTLLEGARRITRGRAPPFVSTCSL